MRFWGKVNKTDYCWLWTAGTSPEGYGRILVDGKARFAHRVSYQLEMGDIPPDIQIDHICHEPGCVRPSHLRLVTDKQNKENKKGPSRRSKSGVRGVYWHKKTEKWQALVTHHGKSHYLGLFDSLEDASAVAKAKRLELYSHNNLDYAQQ